MPKLHLHSCKTAAQTQLIIYTTFLALCDECPVCYVGCASGAKLEGISYILVEANFLLKSNFFVMDKERTMRAPKVRLYQAQPLVRAPKARSYGTHPSLHDRAGTFALT